MELVYPTNDGKQAHHQPSLSECEMSWPGIYHS